MATEPKERRRKRAVQEASNGEARPAAERGAIPCDMELVVGALWAMLPHTQWAWHMAWQTEASHETPSESAASALARRVLHTMVAPAQTPHDDDDDTAWQAFVCQTTAAAVRSKVFRAMDRAANVSQSTLQSMQQRSTVAGLQFGFCNIRTPPTASTLTFVRNGGMGLLSGWPTAPDSVLGTGPVVHPTRGTADRKRPRAPDDDDSTPGRPLPQVDTPGLGDMLRGARIASQRLCSVCELPADQCPGHTSSVSIGVSGIVNPFASREALKRAAPRRPRLDVRDVPLLLGGERPARPQTSEATADAPTEPPAHMVIPHAGLPHDHPYFKSPPSFVRVVQTPMATTVNPTPPTDFHTSIYKTPGYHAGRHLDMVRARSAMYVSHGRVSSGVAKGIVLYDYRSRGALVPNLHDMSAISVATARVVSAADRGALGTCCVGVPAADQADRQLLDEAYRELVDDALDLHATPVCPPRQALEFKTPIDGQTVAASVTTMACTLAAQGKHVTGVVANMYRGLSTFAGLASGNGSQQHIRNALANGLGQAQWLLSQSDGGDPTAAADVAAERTDAPPPPKRKRKARGHAAPADGLPPGPGAADAPVDMASTAPPSGPRCDLTALEHAFLFDMPPAAPSIDDMTLAIKTTRPWAHMMGAQLANLPDGAFAQSPAAAYLSNLQTFAGPHPAAANGAAGGDAAAAAGDERFARAAADTAVALILPMSSTKKDETIHKQYARHVHEAMPHNIEDKSASMTKTLYSNLSNNTSRWDHTRQAKNMQLATESRVPMSTGGLLAHGTTAANLSLASPLAPVTAASAASTTTPPHPVTRRTTAKQVRTKPLFTNSYLTSRIAQVCRQDRIRAARLSSAMGCTVATDGSFGSTSTSSALRRILGSGWSAGTRGGVACATGNAPHAPHAAAWIQHATLGTRHSTSRMGATALAKGKGAAGRQQREQAYSSIGMIRHSGASVGTTSPDLNNHMRGKSGVFRRVVQAARQNNSSRTVIAPEVGTYGTVRMPSAIAHTMTRTMVVTPHNAASVQYSFEFGASAIIDTAPPAVDPNDMMEASARRCGGLGLAFYPAGGNMGLTPAGSLSAFGDETVGDHGSNDQPPIFSPTGASRIVAALHERTWLRIQHSGAGAPAQVLHVAPPQACHAQGVARTPLGLAPAGRKRLQAPDTSVPTGDELACLQPEGLPATAFLKAGEQPTLVHMARLGLAPPATGWTITHNPIDESAPHRASGHAASWWSVSARSTHAVLRCNMDLPSRMVHAARRTRYREALAPDAPVGVSVQPTPLLTAGAMPRARRRLATWAVDVCQGVPAPAPPPGSWTGRETETGGFSTGFYTDLYTSSLLRALGEWEAQTPSPPAHNPALSREEGTQWWDPASDPTRRLATLRASLARASPFESTLGGAAASRAFHAQPDPVTMHTCLVVTTPGGAPLFYAQEGGAQRGAPTRPDGTPLRMSGGEAAQYSADCHDTLHQGVFASHGGVGAGRAALGRVCRMSLGFGQTPGIGGIDPFSQSSSASRSLGVALGAGCDHACTLSGTGSSSGDSHGAAGEMSVPFRLGGLGGGSELLLVPLGGVVCAALLQECLRVTDEARRTRAVCAALQRRHTAPPADDADPVTEAMARRCDQELFTVGDCFRYYARFSVPGVLADGLCLPPSAAARAHLSDEEAQPARVHPRLKAAVGDRVMAQTAEDAMAVVLADTAALASVLWYALPFLRSPVQRFCEDTLAAYEAAHPPPAAWGTDAAAAQAAGSLTEAMAARAAWQADCESHLQAAFTPMVLSTLLYNTGLLGPPSSTTTTTEEPSAAKKPKAPENANPVRPLEIAARAAVALVIGTGDDHASREARWQGAARVLAGFPYALAHLPLRVLGAKDTVIHANPTDDASRPQQHAADSVVFGMNSAMYEETRKAIWTAAVAATGMGRVVTTGHVGTLHRAQQKEARNPLHLPHCLVSGWIFAKMALFAAVASRKQHKGANAASARDMARAAAHAMVDWLETARGPFARTVTRVHPARTVPWPRPAPQATVSCRIGDGNPAVINRQPSLLPSAIQGHTMLVRYDSRSMHITAAECVGMRGDFDGDEQHGYPTSCTQSACESSVLISAEMYLNTEQKIGGKCLNTAPLMDMSFAAWELTRRRIAAPAPRRPGRRARGAARGIMKAGSRISTREWHQMVTSAPDLPLCDVVAARRRIRTCMATEYGLPWHTAVAASLDGPAVLSAMVLPYDFRHTAEEPGNSETATAYGAGLPSMLTTTPRETGNEAVGAGLDDGHQPLKLRIVRGVLAPGTVLDENTLKQELIPAIITKCGRQRAVRLVARLIRAAVAMQTRVTQFSLAMGDFVLPDPVDHAATRLATRAHRKMVRAVWQQARGAYHRERVALVPPEVYAMAMASRRMPEHFALRYATATQALARAVRIAARMAAPGRHAATPASALDAARGLIEGNDATESVGGDWTGLATAGTDCALESNMSCAIVSGTKDKPQNLLEMMYSMNVQHITISGKPFTDANGMRCCARGGTVGVCQTTMLWGDEPGIGKSGGAAAQHGADAAVHAGPTSGGAATCSIPLQALAFRTMLRPFVARGIQLQLAMGVLRRTDGVVPMACEYDRPVKQGASADTAAQGVAFVSSARLLTPFGKAERQRASVHRMLSGHATSAFLLDIPAKGPAVAAAVAAVQEDACVEGVERWMASRNIRGRMSQFARGLTEQDMLEFAHSTREATVRSKVDVGERGSQSRLFIIGIGHCTVDKNYIVRDALGRMVKPSLGDGVPVLPSWLSSRSEPAVTKKSTSQDPHLAAAYRGRTSCDALSFDAAAASHMSMDTAIAHRGFARSSAIVATHRPTTSALRPAYLTELMTKKMDAMTEARVRWGSVRD